MTALNLTRFIKTETSILGYIVYDGYKFYTLEPVKYAIPDGFYKGVLSPSVKFRRKMPFLIVSGRSGIMLHTGNCINQSRGCILVGFNYAYEEDIFGNRTYELYNSSIAFKKLFGYITPNFSLNILNNYGN